MTSARNLSYSPSEASGLLVAGPRLIVLIPAEGAVHSSQLWDLTSGGASMDDLLEWLIDAGFRSFPTLMASEDLGDSAVRVLVRGDAAVTSLDRTGATGVHSGAQSRTWLDVTLQDVASLHSGVPARGTGRWLPLRVGVVPAAGFALELSALPSAADPPRPRAAATVVPAAASVGGTPATRHAPEPADPYRSLTLVPVLDDPGSQPALATAVPSGVTPLPVDADVESLLEPGDHDGHTITVAELARVRGAASLMATPVRDPGVGTVRAVLCSERHANPPNESHCRICGTSLEHGDITTVPRPVLGSLVFDDGPVVALEGSIIIGRSPRPQSGMRSDVPSIVPISSPEHGVSRSHLEVRVEGWSVSVVDLGSTNGTEVALPGEAPRRLRRGEPCLVTPGTVITLGEEVSASYEVAT